MKPIIKKKLALFNPQGFLDGGNASHVIEPQDVEFLKTTKCEVVLISLKKIIFFNRRGLSTVLEPLQLIGKFLGAIVGFCDYDSKKYKMILDMYNNHVPFSMFDSEEIGLLFASSSSKEPSKCNILVHSNSKDQKNKITMELYELGYKPVIAKDKNDYLNQKDNFEFKIIRSVLGTSDRAIRIHIKNNVIIYVLKEFLDSSLSEDFDMKHHQNSLKIGFTYFLFDCEKVSSTNVHAVNFIAKLSTAGAEYGATIAVSGLTNKSITEPLKNDLEDSGVLVYSTMEDFFSDDEIFGDEGGAALSGKKPRHVTKKLVGILPLILETTTKTVESMTQDTLERKNTSIQELSAADDIEKVCVAIAFYGQIEGIIVLALDEEVARSACSVLLDKNDSKSKLLDAVCELANIIGGKLIRQLKRKDYNVDITVPRAYDSLKELISHKKGTKGVQIDFQMHGKSALLFLTK